MRSTLALATSLALALATLVPLPATGEDRWPMRNDPSFDASVPDPAFPTDRGPRILLDAAHHNFHVTEGFLQPFADLATADGYRPIVGHRTFSPEYLAGFEIVLIITALPFEFTTRNEVTTETTFTNGELEALHAWVESGGSLLVFSEHAPFDQAIHPLLQRFGITTSVGTVADPVHHDPAFGEEGWLVFSRENGLLDAEHPIVRGGVHGEPVVSAITFGGSALTGEGYSNLLRLSPTAENRRHSTGVGPVGSGDSQGLAGRVGRGRVVAFGDSNGFTALLFPGPDGTTRALGMNTPHHDWKRLVRNVLRWLAPDAEAPPASPRVLPRLPAVDSAVESAIERAGLVGVAVAVERDGELLHAAGYGRADIDANEPVTVETPFRWASISKTFTAALAVRLDRSGTLSLDSPLSDAPHVSVRQALSHVGGLPEYEEADLERYRREGGPLTAAFVRTFARSNELDFAPSTDWRYSNTGFHLSALEIEKSAGRTFGRILRETLLGPASLEGVDLCDDHQGVRARGYERRDGTWVTSRSVFEEEGIRGDGGLCGNILELVEAPRRLRDLLGDDGFAALAEPTTLSDGSRVPYGLGLRLGDLEGRRLLGHTGGMGTYWSTVGHFPEENTTLAVLVNTDGLQEDALTIFGRVAAEVFELPTDREAFDRGEYPLDRVVPREDGRCDVFYNGFFVAIEPCDPP